MIATAEQVMAHIFELRRIGDDSFDRRDWIEVGTIESPPNADVALSTWMDHLKTEDPERPAGLFHAVLPDGSRSRDLPWPPPNPRSGV